MGEGRGSMFLVCERRSEAGPLRMEGLAERDREVREGLESLVRGALLSVLKVSRSGWEVSLIARRLGDHFELRVGSRVCAVDVAEVF